MAVGVVSFSAAVLGATIGYAIGRFGGRALVLRWGNSVRQGERLNKAEHSFNSFGGNVVVVARYIDGLREPNGIISGVGGMHRLRFLAYNLLGAAPWVGTWVSVGYFSGQHIDSIYNYVTRYASTR